MPDTTNNSSEQLRQACAMEDMLHKVPDVVVGLAGVSAVIPGPHSIPLGVEAGLYQLARGMGWAPFERTPICDALDAAMKPQLPVINTTNGSANSINLTENVSSEINITAITNRVTNNFIHLGVNEDDVRQIVDTALQTTNLRIDQLDQQLEQVINWQQNYDQTQLQQRAETERQQTIAGINQFAGFLGQLGAVTGCQELQQFAVIAQAGIAIAEGIGGILAATGPLAMLGPIGIIGGAALAIFGLFMKKGPDPTQIILEQIQALSKQIAQLGKYIGEQFEQNAKMQQFILKTVIHGFENISKQLNDQIGSLRVELRVELSNIQATLDFLGRQVNIYARNQHLVPFKEICSNADRFLEGGFADANNAKQLEALTYGLENWLIEHSKNDVLTGVAFVEACPTKATINTLLSDLNDHKLNSILSYLNFCTYDDNFKLDLTDASASQQISRTLERIDKIPNPEIQLLGIDKYIALKTEFPMIDGDIRNYRINKIIAAELNGLNFIERVGNDGNFWNRLIGHYYNCLATLHRHAHKYANFYNQEEVVRLNRKSHDSAITQQDDINFHLLEIPENLMNSITGRSINKLSQDFLINVPLANDEDRHLNKTLLQNHLRPYLPNEYIAAEHLDLTAFSVVFGTVQGLRHKEKAYLRAVPYYIPDGMIVYGYPNGVEGKGGRAYVGPMDAYNIPDAQWLLPLTVKYKLDDQEPILIDLNYSGDWSAFTSPGVGVFRGSRDGRVVDGYIDASYCSPKEGEIFCQQMGKFIRDAWNNNIAPQYGTFARTDAIRQKINQYFLHHRATIAYNLLNKTGGGGQLYVEQFHHALLELDICVKQIYQYLYLIGKNVNNTPLANLITSTHIVNDLANYRSRSEQDMSTSLISAIPVENVPTAQRINFQTITNLEDSVLSIFHPKRLFLTGLRRLEAYKGWKILFKQNFPTFSTYINLKDYRQECSDVRNELFQERVYQEFRGEWARPFTEALDDIKSFMEDGDSFNKKDYFKAYKAIRKWALLHSANPLMIQYVPNPVRDYQENLHIDNASIASVKPLDELYIQQLTNIHLKKHGWAWDLKALMMVAEQLSKIKFSPGLKPINFAMWSEGALAYLTEIVFNNNLNDIAMSAKDTAEHRSKVIGKLMAAGDNLKNILLTIAQSSDLFKQLFDDYLMVFEELIKYVELKTLQNQTGGTHQAGNADIRDDIDIFHLLNTEPFKGAIDKFLDRVAVQGVWINAYIEMCFGYDHDRLKQLIPFKDKRQMLEYLKPETQENYGELSFVERLNFYKEAIKHLKEILLRRIEYANAISSFQHYLENYIKSNWPCNTLKLDPTNLGKFGKNPEEVKLYQLIPQKIDLIDQFFAHYASSIDTLELNDITFNTASLTSLLTILLKHPTIRAIRFCNCELPDNALVILKTFLHKLPNLQELALQGYDCSSMEHMSVLSELLKSLPYLIVVDLTNSHLGDKGVCKVVSALKINTRIKDLFLDKNPITEKAYPALLALVSKISTLENLSLADMDLGNKVLALLAVQIKQSGLKKLNIHGNPIADQRVITDLCEYLINLQVIQLPNGTNTSADMETSELPTIQPNMPIAVALRPALELGQPGLDYSLTQLEITSKELEYSTRAQQLEEQNYQRLLAHILSLYPNAAKMEGEALVEWLTACTGDNQAHLLAAELNECLLALSQAMEVEQLDNSAFVEQATSENHKKRFQTDFTVTNLINRGFFRNNIIKVSNEKTSGPTMPNSDSNFQNGM